MPANRKPVAHMRKRKFTPPVLAAFRQMRDLWSDDPNWTRLLGVLHRALDEPPHHYPCACPEGSYEFGPDEQPSRRRAERLWRDLEEAVDGR